MSDEKPTQRAPDYFINTAPEMDALERAAADGKHGRHYQNNEQSDQRHHQAPGASHSVLLELSIEERLAGFTTGTLEAFTNEQDADAALAFLYIAHVLARPVAGSMARVGVGEISFDDVISKIGWDPRSTEERRLMHRRIYRFIQFGERAQVIGQRKGKYKDKHTGKEIDTTVRSSIWRIHRSELPDQGSLFPQEEVPVSVQIVMSPDWDFILTSPKTAQYLPLGEVLGAIPGSKASGAWARVIGLSLASFWRRLPLQALNGRIEPTRRELLERYPPKTGDAFDLLNSNDPSHAIEFWCGAMALLVKSGFIEPSGEALVSAKEMRAALPRRIWAEQWLNQTVEITPGPVMQEAMRGVIKTPPALGEKRRRGRPRKVVPDVLS